jgi:N-acetylmuramoyl-L-alanine amidase
MEITQRPSPNFDDRARPIDMLILHYTGMPTGEEAMARLCDPAAKVSAHYTVEEDGRVFAHVAEDKRAWHAGVSCWRGESDVNSRSIGIEIVNPGHEFGYRRFPAAQIESVIALAKDILGRHAIPSRNVVGHADVAPARKEDPGELFPWARLAEEGIGLWAEAEVSGANLIGEHSPVGAVRDLQERLAAFGYYLKVDGQFGPATRAVMIAFQRHFLPQAIGTSEEGYASGQAIAVLEQLLRST